MVRELSGEVKRLRLYATASTIIVLLLSLSAYRTSGHQRFDTIDVERINVVEKDGRIRLVIANKSQSPGLFERGHPFGPAGGTRAGLIFYNDEGTEDGGLVFRGKRDSAGRYSAGGGLMFDQYETDQTIALQYVDDNGTRHAGLTINDYPLGVSGMEFDRRRTAARNIADSAVRADSLRAVRQLLARERLFAGRGLDGAALLSLADAFGRPRLRLRVDSSGAASIEFVDDRGRVTRRFHE